MVLSYHSLEDRRVKRLFRSGSVDGEESVPGSSQAMHMEGNAVRRNPWLALTRRALPPSEEEVSSNRRSRSARLRAAERVFLPEEGAAEEYVQEIGKGRRKGKAIPVMGAKQLAKLAAAAAEEEADSNRLLSSKEENGV